MVLIAGVDSSTQSCKVVVRDLATGELVRQGHSPHPAGTEVDPEAWWEALGRAVRDAGGLEDVVALGVGGQQHGMVCLDTDGAVVRPALLWNDTRSAADAADLVARHGADEWAEAVGSVPVASFTVSKLAWLARSEPESLARTSAVCLPHDWLTWRLRGGGRACHLGVGEVTTDRGDASGTGYWSPATGHYRRDLLEVACGRGDLLLPEVLGPASPAGVTAAGLPGLPDGLVVSAGTGDNMAAALALGAGPGDVIVSVGTSGVVSAVCDHPVADASGLVAGFADAAGAFLPLACTLNAAQVLDAVRGLLDVGHDEFDTLAQAGWAQRSESGGFHLTLLPYFAGERTPNRPHATGVLAGITGATLTRGGLAAAAVDAVACGLADGLDAIIATGVRADRVLLVGGGARSTALRRRLSAVLGMAVDVPTPGEYVADGAALQAAWAATGERPYWPAVGWSRVENDPDEEALTRYRSLRDSTGPDAWP